MIVKSRKIPLVIRKLEALLRRLPQNHPKRELIKEDFAKRIAGYKGEQSIDYYLTFLDDKDFYILHDLRLMDNTHTYSKSHSLTVTPSHIQSQSLSDLQLLNLQQHELSSANASNPQHHYFQIDPLILSPSFALILEMKNIAGTIHFDSNFHQVIRTYNGVEEVFPDPMQQVRRQKQQLHTWLKQNKCTSIPIETLVIMTNPNSILKTEQNNSRISQNIIRSTNLIDSINRMQQQHKANSLPKKDLRRISNLLRKQHVPSQQDILQSYEIHNSSILKGVQCPKCLHIPMKRVHGKWFCSKCTSSSKDAHIQALEDYAYLIHPTINNKEFREYTNIPSRSLAQKILFSLNYAKIGTSKSTTRL